MTVTINVKGLGGLNDYFKEFPDIANKAAALAINDVAGGTGLTMLRNDMYSQVNFRKGYLDRSRLGLIKSATPSNLEAVIKGRDRPTSLAQFVQGTPARGSKITVMVKPGRSKVLSSAWLVELEGGNMGLAVRLKPGQRLNKTSPGVQLRPNVYLLYGPSVDQILGSVADDNSAKLATMIEREFVRQFVRLSSG